MNKHTYLPERIIHGIFLILGLITVGCVLLITVYMVVSGIPAIRQIGITDFLFGDTWESTAASPNTASCPSSSPAFTAPPVPSFWVCPSDS